MFEYVGLLIEIEANHFIFVRLVKYLGKNRHTLVSPKERSLKDFLFIVAMTINSLRTSDLNKSQVHISCVLIISLIQDISVFRIALKEYD